MPSSPYAVRWCAPVSVNRRRSTPTAPPAHLDDGASLLDLDVALKQVDAVVLLDPGGGGFGIDRDGCRGRGRHGLLEHLGRFGLGGSLGDHRPGEAVHEEQAHAGTPARPKRAQLPRPAHLQVLDECPHVHSLASGGGDPSWTGHGDFPCERRTIDKWNSVSSSGAPAKTAEDRARS